MRTILVAALAVAMLAIPPTTTAADPVTITGSYLVGNPAAYLALDACGVESGLTNGVDSSCATMPLGYEGATVSLAITDALGTIDSASVCFYGADGFISCDAATVPAGTTSFSVSSLGGVAVDWAVTFA